MGMFMSILPANSPDRASFVAAHQTISLLVLILVVLRMAWLVRGPPAFFPGDMKSWERRLAHAVHLALYGLILGFPITGVFETMSRGDAVQFLGLTIPAFCGPNAALSTGLIILHDGVLPLIFYGNIFAHLGAVLKHHFVDRRVGDVRRC
jgi:cytochrome b561